MIVCSILFVFLLNLFTFIHATSDGTVLFSDCFPVLKSKPSLLIQPGQSASIRLLSPKHGSKAASKECYAFVHDLELLLVMPSGDILVVAEHSHLMTWYERSLKHRRKAAAAVMTNQKQLEELQTIERQSIPIDNKQLEELQSIPNQRQLSNGNTPIVVNSSTLLNVAVPNGIDPLALDESILYVWKVPYDLPVHPGMTYRMILAYRKVLSQDMSQVNLNSNYLPMAQTIHVTVRKGTGQSQLNGMEGQSWSSMLLEGRTKAKPVHQGKNKQATKTKKQELAKKQEDAATSDAIGISMSELTGSTAIWSLVWRTALFLSVSLAAITT